MSEPHSDALVFFGATGDLAYKKIFPSLQAMVRRGHLNVPVIGVAKAGWNLDQLKARARDSVEKHGGLDPEAFAKLCRLLHYVDGDYQDPATFAALRKELARPSARPTTSPSRPCCSGWSWNSLASRGARAARASSWKSPSAGTSPRRGPSIASCWATSTSRRSSASTITWARTRCRTCFSSASPIPSWSPSGTATTSRTCRSPWRRVSACRAAVVFYEEAGAIRDVVQNHLLQILANLTMEPPAGTDSESIRDEKVKVLKEIPPLDPDSVVRGQFIGYRQEKGVAPDSKVETFAALRLAINSWRWHGVPFYIRAGKELPVTCTEVLVQFRQPPAVYSPTPAAAELPAIPHQPGRADRLGGDGQGARRRDGRHGDRTPGVPSLRRGRDGRLRASSRRRSQGRRHAVCPGGLCGRGLADRRSGAESGHAVYQYEPKTWGPQEVGEKVSPAGGWHNPVVTAPC